MAEQLQHLASAQEFERYQYAADTDGYGGLLVRARELTRQAVNVAVRTDDKERGAITQAMAAQREAAYGYSAQARQEAAEVLKIAPDSRATQSETALAFALAGDTTRAESSYSAAPPQAVVPAGPRT